MQRRTWEKIIAVVILILLVAGLIWFLLRDKPGDLPPVNIDDTLGEELPPVDAADVPPPQAVSASTVGRIFIERFGSYSSESDFANVADVMELATVGFKAELESLVRDYRSEGFPEGQYSGVSTYVIGTTIAEETDIRVVLNLTTQRREAVGNPGNSTTRYQDVTVVLVKTGEDWLVDDVTWQS